VIAPHDTGSSVLSEVYVAAGSNVEPVVNLRRALAVLRAHYPGLRHSRAWRNPAVGFEGDDFVNLVVGFATDESPHRVLERLHEAEAACGRSRGAPRWAPRSMDLDMLLYGDRLSDEPGLRLPRPDLLLRAYMLRPMAELAPELRHPTLGVTMRELWERFDREAHPMQEVDLDALPGNGPR
jgi:2-amino-4-hydroxy-6-hydroxymethyldihydropteridine diphosphokinase